MDFDRSFQVATAIILSCILPDHLLEFEGKKTSCEKIGNFRDLFAHRWLSKSSTVTIGGILASAGAEVFA